MRRLNSLFLVFVLAFAAIYFSSADNVGAASLTAASVTMTNSRLSYKALISSGAANGSTITIQSGSGDATTNHLFPGDSLCFTDAGNNVCRDNKTYTVGTVVDSTHFTITSPLTTALTATDYAVASQSGQWLIGFTTANTVPIGGKLIVTIPMADSINGNNGIPDTNGTIATSGFDLNAIGTGGISIGDVSGCTQSGWETVSIAAGSGTTDHTLTWTRSTTTCLNAKALVITIGASAPAIVNPAPLTSGHTQGAADVYGVIVSTTSDATVTNILDTATPRVAPVEAVLISANVDETLSLTVAGLAPGTYCGKSQTITTTAYSIPWGHLAASNTLYYAAQSLTVSTNATSGYAVTIQENDQMGRNGNTCTGTAPSTGDYTFSSATCIRDTTCSAATPCSESVMGDWTTATSYPGLGYAEASLSGTDAPFFYSQGGRTWNAKQLPDIQGSETAQTIMSNTGPVSGNSVYVCYTIAVSGTQPSGYYYNIAKYTATATF